MATQNITIAALQYTSNSGSSWSRDVSSGQHGQSQTAAAIKFTMPDNVTSSKLHLNWRAQIPNGNAPANRTIYFDVQTSQPSSGYTEASSSNNNGYWSGKLDNNKQDVPVDLSYNFKAGNTYYIIVNSSAVCDFFKAGVEITYNYFTISYNNGGGGTAPSSQTKIEGTDLTLQSSITNRDTESVEPYTITLDATTNGGTCSTQSLTANRTRSYTFNNWKANDGTIYGPGGTYVEDADTTLTAQWSSSISTTSVTLPSASKSNGSTSRKVTLNANGGTCSSSSLTSTATITYSHTGWFTSASGGTKRNKTYTPSGNGTLFAQFSSTTGSYPAVTLPTPTRSGYKFLGWATSSAAASGTTGSYTPTSNITLYAIWEALATIHAKVNGNWKAGAPYVKVSGKWKKGISVYVKVNGNWELSTR